MFVLAGFIVRSANEEIDEERTVDFIFYGTNVRGVAQTGLAVQAYASRDHSGWS
jgi:hypothetical protein